MKKIGIISFLMTFAFTTAVFAATVPNNPNPEAGLTRDQKIAKMKTEAGKITKSTKAPVKKKTPANVLAAMKKAQAALAKKLVKKIVTKTTTPTTSKK